MTALTRYEGAEMDTMQLGQVLAKSGYFQDARDAAQAVVKVLAGREMGIGPIAAMTGIYIVKGRVTLSANLMAAQIKRSGKYTYSVAAMTNERCELVFFEVHGERTTEIGRSVFTKEDAMQAGLWGSSDPWKKTPRNMLFARCLSNGAKWYTPDVFSGPVYTPDELNGAQPAIDGDMPSEASYAPAPPVNVVTGEVIEPAALKAAAVPPALVERFKELRETLRGLGGDVRAIKASEFAAMTAEQIKAENEAMERRVGDMYADIESMEKAAA